jgi:hypothetical protein
MPCHTNYRGTSRAVKPVAPVWKRTQVTIDQDMLDEFDQVHGHIRTANTQFLSDADHVIVADIYENDGMTIQSTQNFFLVEKDTDVDLANDLGAVPVNLDGMSPEEAINVAAQEWMTENYRNIVHSSESPQDVFIVGQ